MGLGLAFISGSQAGSVVPLSNHAVVGSDPFADLPLRDQGVDSRHVQLYLAGGGYQLLDLRSTGGTFVNGLRAPPGKAVSLVPGTLLRFGEGGPLALLDDPRTFQEQPLQLVREDTGENFPLDGPVVVGRSRSCDVKLNPQADSVASSRHLHVLPAFGRAIVTDLGSANGTFLPGGMRVTQTVLTLGGRVQLGGDGGPWFRVDTMTADVPLPVPSASPAPGAADASESSVEALPLDSSDATPALQDTPPPIPESFSIYVFSGEHRGRIQVACKPEVHFGSFAGLCDFEVATFPRELEDEQDASTRGDSIGPQHASFVLTDAGIDLLDGGEEGTKLNGRPLQPRDRCTLSEAFDLSVGDDVVGLRGRMFRHPRLKPTAPRVGMEHQHPVECLVMERKGDGDVESRLYLLLVRQASIGSADEASICIPYPGVAPLHASLFLQGESLWISQAGETPVAVDGVPLAPGTAVPLRIGSHVYVGATRFEVSE